MCKQHLNALSVMARSLERLGPRQRIHAPEARHDADITAAAAQEVFRWRREFLARAAPT
jgi:hypothetical protein